MPSFAKKVRNNAEYKSAARALGMKPGAVRSRSDMRKVREEARSRANAAQASKTPAPDGNVNPSGGQSYANATTGGNIFNAGFGILGDLATRYGSNEIIGGEVVGSLINAGQGLANVGLADLYTQNTLTSLGQFNAAEDRRRTGNLKDLMSTEAALNSQAIRDTGAEQRKGYVTLGEQERLNIGATGLQQRLGYQEQGRQERLNIGATGLQQRLGYQEQGRQERLNIGEAGLQQRLGYQEQGRQERQNLSQKGLEERKLRADARGAIRSQGARFYG